MIKQLIYHNLTIWLWRICLLSVSLLITALIGLIVKLMVYFFMIGYKLV